MAKKNYSSLCALLVLIGISMPYLGNAAHVEITDRYYRSSSLSSPTIAGYLTIRNMKDHPVTLTSIDSDMVTKSEIHGSVSKDGLVKMFRVDKGLSIAPNEQVKFEPGGYHLMLMGLKKPLKEGEPVNVTLHFSDGAAFDIKLPVMKNSHSQTGGEHVHHH